MKKEIVYVTDTLPRKSEFNGLVNIRPPLSIDNFHLFEWYNNNFGPDEFRIPFKSPAFGLIQELSEYISVKDRESIKKCLDEIQKYNHPKPVVENKIWDERALQMPGDWGPIGKKKMVLGKILTDEANGRVLEAMCGFNSYIKPDSKFKEVVALDFSEVALKKYAFPERKRILYNLENIASDGKINFFDDSCFDTVSIAFGVNYLTQPVKVFREFYRIISENGKLLIVGGNKQGYQDLEKHGRFNPDKFNGFVKKAGFDSRIIKLDDLKKENEMGNYYLIKGIKKI